MKSDKMPYIIYTDIESLIQKIYGCAKNQEISAGTKIVEHIPCGYSISIIWALDHIKTKNTLYRGKDCLKKSCSSLREHAKNITDLGKKNFKKNNLNDIKMIPLRKIIKMISRCKDMSRVWKKSLQKSSLKVLFIDS